MKWLTIICGSVGGGIPFLFGSYLIGHNLAYRALHPPTPGTGACGMPMLAAIVVIAVGTPLGAGIFAMVGWILSCCASALIVRQPERRLAKTSYKPDDNPYRSPATSGAAATSSELSFNEKLALAGLFLVALSGILGYLLFP